MVKSQDGILYSSGINATGGTNLGNDSDWKKMHYKRQYISINTQLLYSKTKT